jgi:hypothetical protein
MRPLNRGHVVNVGYIHATVNYFRLFISIYSHSFLFNDLAASRQHYVDGFGEGEITLDVMAT